MESLKVALISDIFIGEKAQRHLVARLQEAKRLGAELAILPEIACNPWSPATKQPRDEDAEPIGGPRCSMQSSAAKEVGIGLVGAAILNDTGTRYNTCLLFDDMGDVIGTYQKHHLPEEEGFWETSHYAPGIEGFPIFDFRGWKIGIQICSDMNRPQGSHLLAAQGVDIIVGPRSTEQATYERWRPVWIANALTCGCYICSVNRPTPEQGVGIGGASIAISPHGEVIAERCEAITLFTASQSTIKQARIAYPGYLPYRSDMYAQGWNAIKEQKT